MGGQRPVLLDCLQRGGVPAMLATAGGRPIRGALVRPAQAQGAGRGGLTPSAHRDRAGERFSTPDKALGDQRFCSSGDRPCTLAGTVDGGGTGLKTTGITAPAVLFRRHRRPRLHRRRPAISASGRAG